jgi:hypothetical protein
MVVSVESVWVTSGMEALATHSTAMRPKIGFLFFSILFSATEDFLVIPST